MWRTYDLPQAQQWRPGEKRKCRCSEQTKFHWTFINVNSEGVEKISRRNSELIEDFSLGLERRFTVNYKVFDNTQLNYTKNIKSDMSDYRDEVLNQLKVGALTNINETLNYTFSPQWLSWFKPNFTYNTNYAWIQPRNCLLYTSPSPRDRQKSRMPSSA